MKKDNYGFYYSDDKEVEIFGSEFVYFQFGVTSNPDETIRLDKYLDSVTGYFRKSDKEVILHGTRYLNFVKRNNLYFPNYIDGRRKMEIDGKSVTVCVYYVDF